LNRLTPVPASTPLVDGAVGVGDVAVAEGAEEALQLVSDVGVVERDVPGVVGAVAARANFVGRRGLGLDRGEIHGGCAAAFAEARRLGASRDVAQHLPPRHYSPYHAALRAPEIEARTAGDIAVEREVHPLVAHGMQVLRARDQGHRRHDIELVLGVERVILRPLVERR
jgi:hypothetical protein